MSATYPPPSAGPNRVASLAWLAYLAAAWALFWGVAAHSQTEPGPLPAVQWLQQAQLRELGAAANTSVPTPLPDAWNGKNRQGTWVYTTDFTANETGQNWGLYVPRMGNRARIVLNGVLIGQLGSLADDTANYAQRPHFFQLPQALLKVGNNELEMTVQGELARFAGLSTVAVGPYKPVYRLYFWRDLLQTQGSFAIVVLSAILSVFSGALAVTLRNRAFFLFGLACFFCAIRTTYALVIDVSPIDHKVWNWLVDVAFAGYLVCLSLFCMEFVQLHRRWVVAATVALALATLGLVSLHAFWQLAWARQWWTLVMLLYSLSFSVALVLNWWARPSASSRVMGVAGLLAVALGAHDHLQVFYAKGGFGTFALVRYSLLLFLVAMAWTLVDRYRGQYRRETALRDQLQRDLEVRTTQLVAQFAVQAQLVEATAHEQERQRLIHDLHDGIGLQLNTMLHMAESNPNGPTDLLQEVRTTIDHMRMLVDNTQSFDGTLHELFGHVRHRIEDRLKRQGVRLDWRVNLPDSPLAVGAAKAVSFQHLMFELTTNVIKHARATTMSVSAQPGATPGWISLQVADNGIGFDPDTAPTGGGSRTLHKRVAELGGEFALHTGLPQGSRVQFELPPLS